MCVRECSAKKKNFRHLPAICRPPDFMLEESGCDILTSPRKGRTRGDKLYRRQESVFICNCEFVARRGGFELRVVSIWRVVRGKEDILGFFLLKLTKVLVQTKGDTKVRRQGVNFLRLLMLPTGFETKTGISYTVKVL